MADAGQQVAAVLQYGALGLLAIILLGVLWFIRAMVLQQAQRDEAYAVERRKQTEVWVGVVEALALLSERFETHAADTIRWHEKISSGIVESLRQTNERQDRLIEALTALREKMG